MLSQGLKHLGAPCVRGEGGGLVQAAARPAGWARCMRALRLGRLASAPLRTAAAGQGAGRSGQTAALGATLARASRRLPCPNKRASTGTVLKSLVLTQQVPMIGCLHAGLRRGGLAGPAAARA